MARGPTADDPTEMAFVSRVLEDTQRDSIEDEVALLVDARGSHHWAAVVWALMKSRGGLSRGDLPNVRRRLAALDSSFRDGLEDFVNALVAGGHLRQPTSKVTYAHPRVELGLVSAMRTKVGTAEHALSSLVTALVGLDTTTDRRGSETAAHVFAAMVTASPRWDDVTREARAAIDRWLDHSLMQEAEDYASMMRLAATVGSDASIPARLARWFRPAASGAGFFMRSWSAPKHPEEWYESVRAHPCTARICDQFIRKVLTVESRGYPTRMPEHIDRLAVGLDSAYMSAAMSVVRKGYEPNVDVIAFGAMRSRQNREALLAAALEARSRTQFQPFDEKERWASDDGHHNDDWGEHLADDEGASADQILDAYVAATRKDVGWQHLASHKHLHDLASTWIRLLSGTPSEDQSDDELQAVIGIAWGQAIESSVWSLARDVWRPSLERPLLSRIRAGHADRAIRMSAALCALVSAPRLLVDAAKELAFAGQMIELLKLAFDVWSSVVGAPGRKSKIRKYMRFVKELPSPCGEIARAFTSHSGLRHSQFGPDGTEVILRAIDQSDEDLHALLVWLATANGHVRPEEIQRVIACVDRPERARIGLRAAIDAGLWDLVEPAVSHPRADVRQHAFEALVSRSGGIVQASLLKLANDPGSRVRQALVDALAVTSSPGGRGQLDALTRLCADEWSRHSVPSHEDSVYPIARRAADSVAAFPSIPPEYATQILNVATETSDSSVQDKLS